MGAIIFIVALYVTASFFADLIFQMRGKHIGITMLALAALFILMTAQSLRAFGYRSDAVSVSSVEDAYGIDLLKESPDGRGKETAFDIDKKDKTTVTYGATAIEYAEGSSIRHGILIITRTDDKNVAHVELYPTNDAVPVSHDGKGEDRAASTDDGVDANINDVASDAMMESNMNTGTEENSDAASANE